MMKKLQIASRFCAFLTVGSGLLFLAGMSFEATRKPAILIVLVAMIASAAAYSRLHEEISLIEFKRRRSLPEEWLRARVVSRRKWRWYRVVHIRGGARASETGRISYYVTFDVEGFGEMELPVAEEIYHHVHADMTGQLRCKNEMCIDFQTMSKST